MNRKTTITAALAACCGLSACSGNSDSHSYSPRTDLNGAIISSSSNPPVTSFREMPPWIELYRERKVVKVSTVDHVVIVSFESQGSRDEVFHYYCDKFGDEENFESFRDNRDIISFIRDGFGIKITLIDTTKNLWTLEFHRQMI
ncbi:MAG: hypothetical protein HGB15_01330 [Chlorobaculum sp.]|jgi:hypothetical protein|nr:hypothetical protein [Chlorobaculum sp.]